MVGGVISLAGNSVAMLAIPWYVYKTTGDSAKVGLAAAAGIVAYVLGAFFGGNLADRFDRRDVSVVADIASGLMVLAIPALAVFDALSFTVLMVFVFLGALIDAPGAAARSAMVPDVARLGGFSLERANGLIFGSANIAEVLGPALAGVLLVSVATPTALMINGASFFVSMVMLLAFVPR
ncbi:MAG TPA: MFS transporter, partial [Candidatus Stackebrandtia faecavium]|nr:MFS transporter [Candidatus Stackebrandtia faecavium]